MSRIDRPRGCQDVSIDFDLFVYCRESEVWVSGAAMSNPWTYSPRDIALAPLYRTLKTIEDPSDLSSITQVSTANTSAKNNTPFQDASVGRKRSTLIEKLRQAGPSEVERRILMHSLRDAPAEKSSVRENNQTIALVFSNKLTCDSRRFWGDKEDCSTGGAPGGKPFELGGWAADVRKTED